MKIPRFSRRRFLGVAAAATGTTPLATAAMTGTAEEPHVAFSRDLPLEPACDVVVCGGGPAGTAAALAARRAGPPGPVARQRGPAGLAARRAVSVRYRGLQLI